MTLQNEIELLIRTLGVTKEKVREEIVKLYNLFNQVSLNPNLMTVEQEEEITRWLYKNDVHFFSSKERSFK